jgi:hypothetical protein
VRRARWRLAGTQSIFYCDRMKSERELAVELVKQLDGVPINKARNALQHAILLLSDTQIVSANSPLLRVTSLPSSNNRGHVRNSRVLRSQ